MSKDYLATAIGGFLLGALIACATSGGLAEQYIVSGPQQITNADTIQRLHQQFLEVDECLGGSKVEFKELRFWKAVEITRIRDSSLIWGINPDLGRDIYVASGLFFSTSRHELVHALSGEGHPGSDSLHCRCGSRLDQSYCEEEQPQ